MVQKPLSKAFPRDGVSKEDDLLKLLWELPRLWRAALDKRLKPLGLSEAKWRTVLLLSRESGDMSQVELASLLGIEAPSCARLLDRLAKDGWIERRTARSDRRVKTVHLLPKASGIIKKIDAVIFALRSETLGQIPKKEIVACAETLRKIRAKTEASSRLLKVSTSGRQITDKRNNG